MTLQSGASAGRSNVCVQLAAVASRSSSELPAPLLISSAAASRYCSAVGFAPVATGALPGGTGSMPLGRPSEAGWTACVCAYAAAVARCGLGERLRAVGGCMRAARWGLRKRGGTGAGGGGGGGCGRSSSVAEWQSSSEAMCICDALSRAVERCSVAFPDGTFIARGVRMSAQCSIGCVPVAE
jgi:hypothetical protein